MKKTVWLTALGLSLLAVVAVLVKTSGRRSGGGAGASGPDGGAGSIFVYCAGGVKLGVDAVAAEFERETGVKVALTYANSGQLLSQIETTGTGDVYIPGDIGFAEQAVERNLAVGAPEVFCYFVPAMYVRRGNPKSINDIEDLLRTDLRIALVDEIAAMGPVQSAIFRKNKLDETAIRKNVVVSPPTIIDVALAVKMGTVDVGLVWHVLAQYAPGEAEIVPIPRESNIISEVSSVVLAGTRNPTAAAAFLDYLTSEKGRGILREKGFSVERP